VQKLTASAVKQSKSSDRAYKMADGGGLYLHVKSSGKYWRYKYRFEGTEKLLALGVFPDISLAEARKRHQTAREELTNGIDPSEIRKVQKITKCLANKDDFESVAREWFNQKLLDKSDSHKVRTMRILEKDLFPSIGGRPISRITTPELLAVLRKIEDRTIDIAYRAKQVASAVFRYAVTTGRAEGDPSRDLAGALKVKTKTHHAAITDPEELGRLLAAMDGYQGSLCPVSPYRTN